MHCVKVVNKNQTGFFAGEKVTGMSFLHLKSAPSSILHWHSCYCSLWKIVKAWFLGVIWWDTKVALQNSCFNRQITIMGLYLWKKLSLTQHLKRLQVFGNPPSSATLLPMFLSSQLGVYWWKIFLKVLNRNNKWFTKCYTLYVVLSTLHDHFIQP